MAKTSNASVRKLIEYSLEYGSKDAQPPLGLDPPELLRLTWTRQFSAAIEFVNKRSGQLRKVDLGLDFEGRTAVHYSAGCADGEALLELLVTGIGANCLLDEDEDGVTPFHLSARYHSSEQFDKNVQHLVSSQHPGPLLKADKDNFNIAHWAACNAAHGGEILDSIFQRKEYRDIVDRSYSNTGATVFEVAAEVLSADSLKSYILDFQLDGRRNTVLHYAAAVEGSSLLLDAIDIIRNAGKSPKACLRYRNNDSKNVFDIAAEHCRADTLKSPNEQFGYSAFRRRQSKASGTAWQRIKTSKFDTFETFSEQLQLPNDKYDWIGWRNQSDETVLHVAADNCYDQGTLWKLFEHAPDEVIVSKDREGNTALHCLALNEKSKNLLSSNRFCNQKFLLMENKKKQTVLHLAAQHCSESTFEKLKEASRQVGASSVSLKDQNGNTVIHYQAKNKRAQCKLDDFVPAMSWMNNENQGVLHFLAENSCSKKLLEEIAGPKYYEHRRKDVDSNGNTLWHYLAKNRLAESVMLSAKCYERLGESIFQTNFWTWANNDKKTVLHVAAENFSAQTMKQLFDRFGQDCIELRDKNGDTVMHCLARNATAALEIFALSKYGGPRCLKWKNNLDRTVLDIAESSNNSAERLVWISEGYTVYRWDLDRFDKEADAHLKNLIGPLEKLLRMPGRDLLHLTVPGGMHKGATCLHFACKAEHKANIKYLIDEQLQLSAETDSGWSCIGFALENYTIDQIERNLSTLKIKIEGAELWRLIDPAKRALALPDRSTARQVCKDTTEKSKLAGHGSSLALLIEAFEMDNSNVLRSAFCLNKITDKEERLLLKHLENSTGYEGLFSGEELSDAHCELSIIDAAVFEFEKRKIKEEILPDLLLTRQFELIPACVSLLIRLKTMVYRSKGKVGQEKLLGLYNKVTGITVNALDGLYNNADRNGKRLLMKYMRGKLPSEDAPREKQGPKFPCRPAAKEGKVKYCTVMEMIEDAAINDLFATDCVYHLVQKNWSSKLRGDKGGRRCRGTNFTANLRFGFHFASFIAFMIYFAWYVTDFPKTFQYWPPDLVLVAYAASLTMQEFTEFLRRSKVVNVYTACGIRHCPVYVRDTFNFFDCLALLFMWAGLVLKLLMWGCLPGNPRAPGLCVISSGKFIQANAARGLTNEPLVPIQVQYTCQMILSSSFLLWGFRSVSFFNRFQRIGPVISMLRSLIIQDLFPFLLIILVIFYSFGVFFFNLLFPAVTAMPSSTNTTEYQLNAALQIITMPLNLMFTNFDRTGFESADAEKSQTVGSIAHAVGNRWFNNLMLFIFLILSNIVMLNLLIARFNLTVIKMHSKALGIWRTTYYEMLQEYKNISFLPPPFSFLEYPIRICLWCCKRIAQKKNKVASGKTCFYWFPSEYPDEYREFLKFQATQLRSIRPSLSLEVTRNKSDTDILMAHTENVSAATVRELQECLQRLETKVEAIEENRANRKKQRSERHKQRKKDLSKIISKLEQLAPNQNSSRD
uniref:ANK_REP_REGION domain-containing protein n=1 Tax=Macrostomum lignano TaxID=282301 RepID=A0A1I8HFS7_9PLAT